MNTFFWRKDVRLPDLKVSCQPANDKRLSPASGRLAKTATVASAALLALTACGGQAAASLPTSPGSTPASATAAASAKTTAPTTVSCTAENSRETHEQTVFVCTKTDDGKLQWMEKSASQRVTDARAAAASLAVKAGADKAASDAAAQEAQLKAAQEQAAAEAAQQQAAAAETARQEAAAAAAAKVPAPVQPAVPAAPSGCDRNYSGACVPIASDVDCAGGNGNGPAYVRGPVTVVGSDIYGLDRNGDGVGCE
ncbi:hypothetical protein [Pseudarthrobacter sp. ATCC 49987]|uniref:hypothetical protein n=1 Tax=Pseudarthrobacter sp. ATCC 49987 TaxID=2698204 RepID=UPI001F3782E6|nr:hypothetical protein [Pseudarthrobacter sp. ATCC 49987]